MTLEDLKSYLRIDYDDDDATLLDLIAISQNYIDAAAGTAYKNDSKAVKLAEILQKKLVYDLYENRGTEIPANTKKDAIVSTILDKLSNYDEGEVD